MKKKTYASYKAVTCYTNMHNFTYIHMILTYCSMSVIVINA